LKTGHLKVCESGSHGMKGRTGTITISRKSFHKTVSLKPTSTGRVCSAKLTVAKGNYKVTQSKASHVQVLNIKASPTYSIKSLNLAGGKVKVGVSAGGSSKVVYVNQVSSSTATSSPSPSPSPDPSSPPPSPTPTPTASSPPPGGDGFIEVCKKASDWWVSGSVNVTITDGGFSTMQTVPVGECTGPLQVPAGTATVTESAPSPYYLTSVKVTPAADLVGTNLAASSTTVTVVPSSDSGTETLVDLYNSTHLGYFKVCKTITSNSGDLITQGDNTFSFDLDYQFPGESQSTLNTAYGEYGSPPDEVWVTVPQTNTTVCTPIDKGLPVGTVVTVTENDDVPNTIITGDSVQPGSQSDGSTASSVTLVISGSPTPTAAEFTDEAMGTIEICKQMDDSNWYTKWQGYDNGPDLNVPGKGEGSPYDGTLFWFAINGDTTHEIAVAAGECSRPIQVPAGTATILEDLGPGSNFHLDSFTAVGPDGSSRLLTSGTANPITVSVPWGGTSDQGVGNETLVTATNSVNTGQIKVCKILGPGMPYGPDKSYDFETTWKIGNHYFSQYVTLTPTGDGTDGEVCGFLTGPIPVVDGNGDPIEFTTTECSVPTIYTTGTPPEPLPSGAVEPTDVTYSGNGVEIDSNVYGQDPPPYYLSADLGQGVNVVTFTNSLLLDP
jgi:hypothetical protein